MKQLKHKALFIDYQYKAPLEIPADIAWTLKIKDLILLHAP
jgi:hypothetical protein